MITECRSIAHRRDPWWKFPDDNALDRKSAAIAASVSVQCVSTPESAPAPYTAAAADSRLLRVPITVVAVVGIIAIIVSTIVAGIPGLTGGLIATAVVLAFFGGGQYVITRVLRNNPALAMNTALLVYIVQILVMFVLMLILRDATFFAPKAFAGTAMAGIIAWTVAIVWVMTRTQVLYVEPGTGPGQKNEQ